MTESNDKKVPALRFKGFTDDWEQRKLGELGSLKNGMNFSKEAMGVGFPFINLQNIFGKTIIDIANLGKAKASDLQLKEYSLHQGDVLFVRSSVKLEGVGQASLVPKTLKNTTYSGFIIRFRDKYGLDNNFKKFIFSITPIRKQIISHATNSANKNISQSVLENIKLIIPNKLEQKKIGSFFTQLDNLITLQQRKLSLIKTLKRSFLSDLFFKTSTNSIVITLKQVTSIRGGYAFKSKEFTENGYPIIKIANISNNGEIKGPYSYTNNFNKKYILTKNDIVLAMSGATTGKIAKLRSSKAFLQNQRIGYFCKTNNIDYNYLYYLLISDQFKKQLKRITIAGAQPNVSSSDIENFRFSVLSSKNKQKKISDFLNKLDTKIRITNKKITIFSQLKRSLLNNMFI
ncbi:restriction endonuclease subunit S [Lactobacillus johnsonii]|uniref:restriction endonuclease subunit S n=1 Tax=Lactobacillus johnsonii TaxID=33959 RepID=UPI00364804E2